MGGVEEIEVLEDASRVGAALSPLRREILDHLGEPDSATGLAARLGLTRQKVNYHLRELEKGGFVERLFSRQRRGFVEQVYRAKAQAFVVDPALLGALDTTEDRFSSAWLLATTARVFRDVATLRDKAKASRKRLLTQTMEVEARFRTPRDFEAFSDELMRDVAKLLKKHGANEGEPGRRFRFVMLGHPARAGESAR